ncbi:MAG: sodium:proton exchanger, partial [Pseudonocardiales bacterium]|nr:sodium:proton exchanger [Pseudonocardiales bacterium]
MTPSELADLTFIALAAVLGPLLARASGRLAIPGVVMEIGLGILLGPVVLGWAHASPIISTFASLGLSLLMFLAGFELEISRLRGRPLRLAATSWAGSLALASVVGLVLLIGGHSYGNLVVALALTTTALGTLLPALADAGILETLFGRHVLAVGSVAEFGPIVVVALLLSGNNPIQSIAVLLGFGLLAILCALAARRPWGQRVNAELRRGLHSSSQLPVRISMLLIVTMVLVAEHLGLDILLGAFSAGVIVRVAIAGQGKNDQTEIFRGKLEAIGFGFVVPIFFVVSGMRLDLDAFGRHPGALLTIPVFFALLLLVRGLPTWL